MIVLYRITEMPAKSVVILTYMYITSVSIVYCRNTNLYNEYMDQNENSNTIPFKYQAYSPRKTRINPDRLGKSEILDNFETLDSFNVINYERDNERQTPHNIISDTLKSELMKFDDSSSPLSNTNALFLQSKDKKADSIKTNNRLSKRNDVLKAVDESREYVHKNNNKNKDTNMNTRKRGLMDMDSCETERVEIDLRFEEHVSGATSSYQLVCAGKVVVKKCEGLCNSSVSPSVNHYDGFQRACTCCKEGTTTRRRVTISTCSIGSEEVHGRSLTRPIVEPLNCSCQECRN